MSPINFERLRAELPEYSAVWDALQPWFEANRRKQYVELAVLLRALKRVDQVTLVLAINAMVQSDMLAMSYRIRGPEGDLLEGDYDEPDQIPDELWARDASHRIPRSEGDLVSGFRWEPADAA